jgi:phenylalanyl-tRNA synthetase alpha chain
MCESARPLTAGRLLEREAMGLLEDLKALLAQAQADAAALAGSEQIEQFRIRYLGAKGAIKQAMTRLKEVSPADKPAAGKLANDVKTAVEALLEKARGAAATAPVAGPKVDVTLPGAPLAIGRPHLLTQTINELTRSSPAWALRWPMGRR